MSTLDLSGSFEPDPAFVAANWAMAMPIDIAPIATGTNNRSWFVRSETDAYVMKWHRNQQVFNRLRFEHALLNALAAAGLPFAVPSPLPTVTGDTILHVNHGAQPDCLTLCRQIPGRAARFGSSDEALRCGAALARLDDTLAVAAPSLAILIPDAYDDLVKTHPSVPDPLAAVHRVIRDRVLACSLTSLLAVAQEQHRQMSGWDRQLIHGDFYPTNTLVDAGQVTGILDFEAAGMGYRAMDFAIGLAAFSTKDWGTGCAWPLVDAFAQGYLQELPLTENELAATPKLLLIREATSFIHWLGRQVQGLTTADDIVSRAHRLLALDRWLDANAADLVRRLIGVSNAWP